VPNLCVNIFSLNKSLKKGFKVSNDVVVVRINCKHVKLTFECVINGKDGRVTEILMKPITLNNINGFANVSIINERTYDINHFQKLFGRYGQETLSNMVKLYGFKSSRNFETCEKYSIAKAC
jgi:hypothetical protein